MGAVALARTRANPDSIVCRRSSRQGRASVCPRPPPLTRRPAPGLLRLGFGAWRIACDSQLSGLLFSLVPALQATRPDLAGALRCGAATAAPTGAVWLRKCVVTAQGALSLVLVVGGGLFGST